MAFGRKTLVPLVFALLAPVIPAFLIVSSQSYFAGVSDLPQYYAAARLLLQGHGREVYDVAALGRAQHELFPEMKERIVALYLPPPSLPLILPLGVIPPAMAQAVWLLLLVLSTLFSVLLLTRAFRLSAGQALWLWAALSLSGPFYEALRIGQLAPIMLLALAAALFCLRKERSIVAGFCLATLVLKPQELLPLFSVLLGAGRYRAVAALCGGIVVLTAASCFLVGLDGYASYVNLVKGSIEHSALMQPELNPTVRGQLLRLFPDSKSLVMNLSACLAVVANLAIFFLARRFARGKSWLRAAVLLALPAGFVTAVHVHDYDLILLAPAILLFFTDLLPEMPVWLTLGAMLSGVMFLLPFYISIHYDYLLKGGIVNPLFLWLFAFAALVVRWDTCIIHGDRQTRNR